MNNSDNSYSHPQTTWYGHKITKILCFGDSNTWGHAPLSDNQLNNRWPRQLKTELPHFEWIIDAMPGRTSRYDEPMLGLTSGEAAFRRYASEETLLILMLGTNDLCQTLKLSLPQITQSLQALIDGWPVQQLLLIAPAPLGQLTPRWLPYFAGRQSDSQQLAQHYLKLSQQLGCDFIDAAKCCNVADDGLHLNAYGHNQLANTLVSHLKAGFKRS